MRAGQRKKASNDQDDDDAINPFDDTNTDGVSDRTRGLKRGHESADDEVRDLSGVCLRIYSYFILWSNRQNTLGSLYRSHAEARNRRRICIKMRKTLGNG